MPRYDDVAQWIWIPITAPPGGNVLTRYYADSVTLVHRTPLAFVAITVAHIHPDLTPDSAY